MAFAIVQGMQQSILVADHAAATSRSYCEAFGKAGFDVSSTTTGQDTITTACTDHPDLIVIDPDMPDVQGHRVIEQIRQDSWGRQAKIIVLTNSTDSEDIANAVAAGCKSYLLKVNVDADHLVSEAKRVLCGY